MSDRALRSRLPVGALAPGVVGAAITASLLLGAANQGAGSGASLATKVHVVAVAAGLLTFLLARASALIGPIVFSAADLQWRLTSPAPHGPMVLARLARQSAVAATLAVIAAAFAVVALDARSGPHPAWAITTTLTAGALAGAAIPYAGWLIECSPRASRLASPLRLLSGATVLAALGAVVSASGAPILAGLLGGPLAWPLIAAGDVSSVLVGGASVLASAGVLLTVVLAARARAGSMSLERLEDRATTRRVLGGSLLSLDWRTLLVALQPAPPAWTQRRSVPGRTRAPALWLAATLLLRQPGRLAAAAALALGAGGWASWTVARGPQDGMAPLGICALAYLAATLAGEPIRVAYDQERRTLGLLGRTAAQVAIRQTLGISAVLGLVMVIGAASVTLALGDAGALPAPLVPGLIGVALIVGGAVAASARAGGHVPTGLLIFSGSVDPNVALVVAPLWLLRWPLIAVIGGLLVLAPVLGN